MGGAFRIHPASATTFSIGLSDRGYYISLQQRVRYGTQYFPMVVSKFLPVNYLPQLAYN